MKKFALAAWLMLVFLTAGCSDKITEEDLIGGKWTATAGFENKRPLVNQYAVIMPMA